MRIPEECLDFIGTIQVPHHGSNKNFDNHILQYYIRKSGWEQYPLNRLSYIACMGAENKFDHPSSFVVSEIVKEQNLFCISEKSETGYREIWQLRI
ncbi:MAG: hypothetical protein K2G52_03695 [Muribaculaceae bacterium]|nr:hypothetical protein [Muribaculaceae bacterium]